MLTNVSNGKLLTESGIKENTLYTYMKYYIIHYTKNPLRRIEMEKQLESIGATDVEWITEHDKEDEIISKMKEKTGSPLRLSEISCSMKHYEALYRMVRDSVNESIILEDDVIFHPEFKIARKYHPCGFLRLGLGVGTLEQHKPPPSTKVYITSNPGGSEAQWVSLPYATLAIKNISFEYSIDHVHYALLHSFTGEKLRCMNLCYQTSLAKESQSEIEKALDWDAYKNFCITFRSTKRYSYSSLSEDASM